MNRAAKTITTLATLGACAGAAGQSLFQRPVEPVTMPMVEGQDAPVVNPVAALEGVSLYAVQPQAPRRIKVNDLVTIIVNQSSAMEHDQALDTEKKYRNTASIDAFPDLRHLWELQVFAGRTDMTPELSVNSNSKFESDGEFARQDRVTARITAQVIDVKPNGLLVLEARSTITTDSEQQLMVLSGTARMEDVTAQNTLQSTQLFDLRLETHHTGEVRRAADKGIITRVLEAVFNF